MEVEHKAPAKTAELDDIYLTAVASSMCWVKWGSNPCFGLPAQVEQLEFAWDFEGDGEFDDATTPTSTASIAGVVLLATGLTALGGGLIATGRKGAHTAKPRRPAGAVTARPPGWVRSGCVVGWFTLFRLYCPTEAFFDQTWRPNDFEPIT